MSTGEGLARVAMDFYKRLYRIERQATAQEMTPEQRWALRQAHARPLMAQFKDWLESHHPSVLPKSTLGKAFHYSLVRCGCATTKTLSRKVMARQLRGSYFVLVG
jgi:transposase